MSFGKIKKPFGGKMFNNIFKGKKVLITGHTGFKGSWLSLWLLKLGANVSGLSLGEVSSPSHFSKLGIADKIDHHELDVRNRKEVISLFQEIKPDIVFHLAANAIVRECYENPAEAFETNLMGSINVMEALRTLDDVQAAVMITSDKCYENVEWEFGYREDDRLGGKDPYSASKASAELAFSTYYRSYFEESGLRICSARAGNVIGGGDWARDRIVPDCMKAWSLGKEVEIRNPNATRPWQIVLEPLSGYLHLAAELMGDNGASLAGESFNFGPSASVNQPVWKLIEEMQKEWDQARYITNHNEKEAKKEAGLLKLCCDKALFHLDWEPTLEFDKTMEMTVKWYQTFYDESMSVWDLSSKQIDEYEALATEKGITWTK